MFTLNEKVVYPGHGVALVKQIIERIIDIDNVSFYELHFLHKDIMILVPMQSAQLVGIRKLESEESVDLILKDLAEPTIRVPASEFNTNNWNKRNKEYQLKLRTGKLKDLSDIYKDLRFISCYKELSFGEKNILHQAEVLLAEEISIVQKKHEDKTIEQLRLVCGAREK